jgi:hypothetical protein
MKKILLLIFLAISLNSAAEWKLIEKNSEYELYVESNSVSRKANLITATWMYSYYKQNVIGTKRTGYQNYQSFSYDDELNCATKERRLFSSSPYINAMGIGRLYTTNMNANWMPIDKFGSGPMSVYAFLCGK